MSKFDRIREMGEEGSSSIFDEKKKTNKRFIYAIGGVALVIIVGTVLAFGFKFRSADIEDGGRIEETPVVTWDTRFQNAVHPVELKRWQMKPYDSKNDYSAEVQEWSEEHKLDEVFMAYTSKDAVYVIDGEEIPVTSDRDKIYLEDGTLNPAYTNVLKEDLIYYSGLYINRIINPIFGNWFLASEKGLADTIDLTVYEDSFTDTLLEEFKYNTKKVPFMLDFEGNSYGGMKLWYSLQSLAPYYGEVVSPIKLTQVGNDYTLSADVKYSAFLEDGVKLDTRIRELVMTITPGDEKESKLMISEVSLSEKE